MRRRFAIPLVVAALLAVILGVLVLAHERTINREAAARRDRLTAAFATRPTPLGEANDRFGALVDQLSKGEPMTARWVPLSLAAAAGTFAVIALGARADRAASSTAWRGDASAIPNLAPVSAAEAAKLG